VWGADAASFLNGMLTQKLTGRAVGSVFGTARADAKGRVVGLFDVWAAPEDTFYLLCEGSEAKHWAETLDRFVFLEDVQMEEMRDWAVYTIQGSDVSGALEDIALAAPVQGEAVEHQEVHILGRSRAIGDGVDVVGRRCDIDAWKKALPSLQEDQEELERMRIAAGQVRWPLDMAGRTLPHELGLRDTHLHFQKGCYVGQEIIHRLEVRGGIRRQVVVVSTSEAVAAGEDLLGEAKKEGKMLGQVSLAAGGYLGLAQVRIESAREGEVWRTSDGVEVRVVSCPHAKA